MITVSITKTRATPLDKLSAMGSELKVAMTGPLFIGPQPMTPTALQTLITNFDSTQSAAKQGGKLARAPYVTATEALKDGLALYAPYISKIASEETKPSFLPDYCACNMGDGFCQTAYRNT